jgi:6-phosphogluconolactonase
MNRQVLEMKPLEGYIASFSVDRQSGALTELARRPAEGDRPTYLTIDGTGKFLFTANNLGHLVGESVAVFPIQGDGTLGDPVQKLRTGVRAHQIRVHPGNKYVYVPNIDSDNISQFAFDETSGRLTPLDPAVVSVEPMQGPRHLDFHPNGKWVYVQRIRLDGGHLRGGG